MEPSGAALGPCLEDRTGEQQAAAEQQHWHPQHAERANSSFGTQSFITHGGVVTTWPSKQQSVIEMLVAAMIRTVCWSWPTPVMTVC
jgi:hypothetical protein